ncbi:unnamed protein product [Ostreobium quekettii]|uniref:Uncharacterized protein n=1 Tax=Ostreobium quekettii TaxID=121088 RepID=A0A8S1IXC1_9CHLO|nr:unnamed protein product [Ostreobium quekettii]
MREAATQVYSRSPPRLPMPSACSVPSWRWRCCPSATGVSSWSPFGFGAEGVAEALLDGRVAPGADQGGAGDGVEFLLANKLFLQRGLRWRRTSGWLPLSGCASGLEEVDFAGYPMGPGG